MNTEKFWSMIEDAKQQSMGNIPQQKELLLNTLASLPIEDIQEVHQILSAVIRKAYRADLWEAVSIIACACGEEAFLDFRGWLVAQGQITFEKVLEDPENLADIITKQERLNIFDGDIPYIAADAYERKTNTSMPDGFYYEMVDLAGGSLRPERERLSKFPRIITKIGECDGTEWLD